MVWNENWRRPVRQNTLRRLVFTNSMSDIFEHTSQLDILRSRLWTMIEETPYLDWLLLTKRPQNIKRMLPAEWLAHPLPNVWLGTTVESHEFLDRRMFSLLDVPAVVHFVSAEPLIGPVDFEAYFKNSYPNYGIDWVITGGESGPTHRPMDVSWVRDIDLQCRDAGVAHFFKQCAALRPGGDCILDGIEVKDWPRTGAPEPDVRIAA